jgi:hypothetical protein
MEISLPAGITQKDVDAFLKYYQAQEDKPPRPTKDNYPDYCSQCCHFHTPDIYIASFYCVVSCDCTTQVGNHKTPTRFLAKKEIIKDGRD